MAFGVTVDGFIKKRLADIKSETEQSLRDSLGNNINLMSSSVLAQIVGVFSDREAALWELAEQVYFSQYPDSSEGVPLDNVSALTNVVRLDPQVSIQQDLHLFGDVGTVVPQGTQVSVLNTPTITFKTKADRTLIAGTDEQQTITPSAAPAGGSFKIQYVNQVTGAIAYNASAATIEAALNALSKLVGVTVAGTIAGGLTVTFEGDAGKIDHPLLEIVDNSLLDSMSDPVVLTVLETVQGVPQAVVDAEATETGPKAAPAYSLIVIDTPVSGLDRVLNIEDADIGRDIETDNELKVRRRTAQKGDGAGTVEAIRARLLKLIGVENVLVIENVTFVVDGNGLPPKSFRAYVQGGDDQEIVDTIWKYKPAGIESDGAESGTAVDTQGMPHTIEFSRPDNISIFISIEITEDGFSFPDNGEDLVRAALAGFINTHNVGEDIIVYPKLIATLDSIPGILDLQIGIDITPAPAFGTDDNIIIDPSEIARVVDPETDIVVTVV